MATTDTTLADVIGARTEKGILAWIFGRQTFWVFLAALAACLVLSMVTTTFDTPQNLFNVARNFAFVGIIAIGMTAVIITGGIDLSVGSTVVMSAMVASVIMSAPLPEQLAGLPPGSVLLVAFLASMLASLAIGFVNGLLIAVARMPAFVVTLGMLSVARSLATVLSNNKMIYQFGPDQPLLIALGGGTSLGLPHPLYILAILGLVTGFALRWTRWGRYLYAMGGNERAAVLTGVPVVRTKISVYMFSAFTAGLAGFLMIGWLGSVTTNLGQAMELTVIAAAVIGGANLAGGSGTAFGAIVGAALIEIIRNSLILLGISTFWQGTFVGSFIVLAVAFDRVRRSESKV